MDRGYTGLDGLYDYFLTGKIKLHKQKSKQTNILLPTLLPNLFTYGLQMLISFEEYPKRDSRLGFTIIRK